MFTGIYGHKKQIEFLERSKEIGRIAHAYLFCGPAFVGKRTVARAFAESLLVMSDEGRVTGFNPDLIELSSNETIKIEEIRELIYKLSLKPYQAQYKVAIIDNADNMTVEAQNSLLKLLEEPKSYTVIILVTSNPGKILRTISSRAQKINFGPVESNEFKSLITDKIDEDTREIILSIAAGRPGLAKDLSQHEESAEKIKQNMQNFAILTGSDLPEKLKLAYDLADLETFDLKQELDFWLIQSEHVFRYSPNAKTAKNISQINLSRRFLDQNVNSKLLLTNLMLNLSS